MERQHYDDVGGMAIIRGKAYRVEQIESRNPLLQEVILVRDRKLYTAKQGPNGDYGRPTQIKGWVTGA